MAVTLVPCAFATGAVLRKMAIAAVSVPVRWRGRWWWSHDGAATGNGDTLEKLKRRGARSGILSVRRIAWGARRGWSDDWPPP